LATQEQIAPLSGSSKVDIVKEFYEPEYVGKPGKVKGLQILVGAEAKVATNLMNTTMDELAEMVMPWAYYTDSKLSITGEQLGSIIPDEAYLDNLTLFVKRTGGNYMKIMLYSAMNEGDFSLEAKDKVEGMIPVEIFAHFDAEDDTKALFDIEDIAAIADPPA
jgi:hypothetical protein